MYRGRIDVCKLQEEERMSEQYTEAMLSKRNNNIMIKGKVQTNDFKVNVLVSTDTSSNFYISHLNKSVKVERVLSNEEIIERWRKREIDDELVLAKEWIKKQKIFAVSDCTDKKNGINYGDIVQFSFPEKIINYDR